LIPPSDLIPDVVDDTRMTTFLSKQYKFNNENPSFAYLHLSSEYLYEFIAGSRLSDELTLDACERNITLFAFDFDEAINYTR
jgi:hypothetical protein